MRFTASSTTAPPAQHPPGGGVQGQLRGRRQGEYREGARSYPRLGGKKDQPEGNVTLEGKQKELKGIVDPILTKLETTLEQRIADDLEAGAWREVDLALRALVCALSVLQALQKARSSEG
ncbi:unnamed protein product [Prorocentrum cordatum]|uniref:Uncharacterized protein n=1 Tax=Prorocentrum cordatum TaxID=2364126 RepID=A0ABN9T9F2_9DINO|nr:unnamed protein product [Polarella glacialis]